MELEDISTRKSPAYGEVVASVDIRSKAFGANGAGHLRLSYASSVQNIKEALDRMRDALEEIM